MNPRLPFQFLKTITLGIFTGVLSLHAYAQANEKGNGGVAVVCRGQSGVIIHAEILDLFEGRNQHGSNQPGLLYTHESIGADTLV